MVTSIFIRNMRIRARHGVMVQERTVGADFVVNVRIDGQLQAAMHSDALADTISYADVADIIRTQMAQPSALLEHVAGRICQALFDQLPLAQTIHLEITKLNPPMGIDCDGAGFSVEIQRGCAIDAAKPQLKV